MEYLYDLCHSYKYGAEEKYTNEKSLGIFSSREKAEAAIDHYIKQPGFCDYDISCFKITECKIDEPYLGKIITTRY